ncbi:putative transcriptional regulator [Vibrio alginolyticus NBRC 15630 = ATCC 17749]|nr:putative transcriptional regulator [Vibrio alginolyticus NBRC 15630 = ATCC 17749]
MSQKPVFKTRTQLVEEAIRTQILKGELKTGQPLRQDALAKEFNVSRIPVREALVQLEAQGLVSFEPHKGATVTELSPEKINELFELRAVVECHILERAIQNMTDADLERARSSRTFRVSSEQWRRSRRMEQLQLRVPQSPICASQHA